MTELTTQARRIVEALAQTHGLSAAAVETLLRAVAAGNGTQAQFNHPELGGMGQWAQGGMLMIGDMFNQGLKYRVGALCEELAGFLRDAPAFAPPPQSQMQSQGQGFGASLFAQGSGSGWPAELGAPSSVGAQNDMSYAVFPATRRLAIRVGGELRIYDTGDLAITGVSQQQGGDRSLTFTSQRGLVRVADLPRVGAEADGAKADAAAAPPEAAPPQVASPPAATPHAGGADILVLIEKLAALREKNILTDAEFAAKKAELLDRL